MSRQIVLTCYGCGKEFRRFAAWVRNKTGKYFCSYACSSKGRSHKKTTWIQCKCLWCEKKFAIRKGAGYPGKFCSRSCLGKWRSSQPGKPRKRTWKTQSLINEKKKEIGKCEICGSTENLDGHHIVPVSVDITLMDSKDNIQILCEPCHQKQHPELKFPYRKPKSGVTKPCKRCGSLFYLKPSKSSRMYCSHPCAIQDIKERRHKNKYGG